MPLLEVTKEKFLLFESNSLLNVEAAKMSISGTDDLAVMKQLGYQKLFCLQNACFQPTWDLESFCA